MLQRVFHININVSDMERSVAFYRLVGFETVETVNVHHPDLGAPLGIAATHLRATFMRLPSDAQGPMLDLVQFVDPPPSGEPYPTLNNIGICRIAFRVADIEEIRHRFAMLGLSFIAPMHEFVGPAGEKVRTACVRDPDGAVLQLFAAA